MGIGQTYLKAVQCTRVILCQYEHFFKSIKANLKRAKIVDKR